jgi:hypothetical protein
MSGRLVLAAGGGQGRGGMQGMSRLVQVIAAMSAVAAVAAGGAGPVAGAVPAAVWPAAVPGPGIADTAGNSAVGVLCVSADFCEASGSRPGRHGQQAFVAAERDGSWGAPAGLPGLAALSAGGDDGAGVSCVSAGNCTASGYYTDGHHRGQGFVAAQTDGHWRRAIPLPGLAALNAGGNADAGVLCASAGNCTASGDYADRHGHIQGFVASERDGSWSRAIPMPGLAALNIGGNAEIFSMSCASAGNCAAGGFYTSRHAGLRDHYQGFVADERDGTWSRAIQVPGLAALNTGGNAQVFSVSCGAPGNCAAGGYYHDRHSDFYAFIASERHGRWGPATEVPGLPELGLGGRLSQIDSVSCGSAGNCAAGGEYYSKNGQQGFIATERHGRWSNAIQVPGLAALNAGGGAEVVSVSCIPAGNCAAGGYYTGRHDDQQGFVTDERNGRWGTAAALPGLAALNAGGQAEVWSVSCAPAGNCAAAGQYTASNYYFQGFVASEQHGHWSTATQMPP